MNIYVLPYDETNQVPSRVSGHDDSLFSPPRVSAVDLVARIFFFFFFLVIWNQSSTDQDG